MIEHFISQETQLDDAQFALLAFWDNMVQGKFTLAGTSQQLFYCYHIPPTAKHAVFVCQGRIECAKKYRELLWELSENGYAVFTLDHLGQGNSDRLCQDTQKGHINNFNQYYQGVKQFFEQVIQPKFANQVMILAHSMGGAIACQFLASLGARQTEYCRGVYLSAPMFAIDTGSKPLWLVTLLAKLAVLCGASERYAVGQGPYAAKSFNDNELTHSRIRYRLFRSLYAEEPQLQLGGITYGWLNAALNAMSQLPQAAPLLPCYIASASGDTIVKSAAHRQLHQVWSQQYGQCKLLHIEGAKHELLFEQDCWRNLVMQAFYHFASECLTDTTGS
ncbi:alpha/beta fold hydrolase [Pseudoalteromonas fenneropenaei]|uniref:Alpha/beta fold hydrolase n=1 Tax=Pseudoalteromonas fenneropenaei TaxID=1737459 RepID=A0ABV7CHB5_9GAMM